MDNSKNFILAIALSMLVIFGWGYFFPAAKKDVKQQNDVAIKAQEQEISQPNLDRDSALLETSSTGQRVQISSEKLKGSILLKGARFDDLILKEYRQESSENSPNVSLLNPSMTGKDYFVEFGWVTQNPAVQVPGKDTIWKADKEILTENEEVNLFWTNEQGIKFAINVKLDSQYMFKIRQYVENESPNDVILSPYGFINRIFDVKNSSDFAILHEGPIGVFDSKLKEVTYKDLAEKDEKFDSSRNGWIGFSDKYWLTAIIPDKFRSYNARFFQRKNADVTRYQVDYVGEPIAISSGTTVKIESELFAGAKKLNVLDEYSSSYDIKLFDRAVDFGWLYPITKPIFHMLQILNKLLGNFGLAILAITVLIKLLMFPVANKSYKSMNAMKKIQPQLAKLKETYGKEPMVLNQKVMELYKREKVNPFSGCLPILIQIPVFFALYKVIFVTIEMRHAPFFGWISDLSAQDPTSIWNLFGLLPFAAPNFLAIGLWPVIMAVTMYVQQRLNPAPTDPVQAQVMKFLPLMFLFMFFSFPAGLVLYWAWNNVLSIIQQMALMRNNENGKR